MKKLMALALSSVMVLGLAACGQQKDTKATKPAETKQAEKKQEETKAAESKADTKTAATDKPVVWWNRQPSNSTTGELDMEALNFNKNTYYVGFDANQGAELQGEMIKKYIEKNGEKLDRNKDGIIGYVLAIGDIGHNDSVARTRGVRKALGTAVEKDGVILHDAVGTNVDGKATVVKDGEMEIGGKKYIIRELASQEMKNSAGATWDAGTAGNAISTWSSSFGDQIDIVASNNDGMGMAMFNGWSNANKVPTFGYDANTDAVAAIKDGYGGTISQHADVQAYLTLRVLRNVLDGGNMKAGIDEADDAGNVLTKDVFKYVEKERSFYALNVAVTAENYQEFLDATKPYEPASKQLDEAKHPKKKIWLNTYNSADNFLGSTYKPLLQKYDKLLNLEVEYVDGDGQNESNITNRLGDPAAYDGFGINMIKTDNAASYTQLLK